MTRIVGPLWKAIDDYVESLGDVIVNGKFGVGVSIPLKPVHVVGAGSSEGIITIESPDDISMVIKSTYNASNAAAVYTEYQDAINPNCFKCGKPSTSNDFGIGYSAKTGFNVSDLLVSITKDGDVEILRGDLTIDGSLIQKGIMIHGQTPQVLTGAGAVDVTSAITHLVATGSPNAVTLADGAEGQEKTIILKTKNMSYHASMLTPAHFANGSTIEFDAVGEIITLMFTNGAWHWTGGLGVTIA